MSEGWLGQLEERVLGVMMVAAGLAWLVNEEGGSYTDWLDDVVGVSRLASSKTGFLLADNLFRFLPILKN